MYVSIRVHICIHAYIPITATLLLRRRLRPYSLRAHISVQTDPCKHLHADSVTHAYFAGTSVHAGLFLQAPPCKHMIAGTLVWAFLCRHLHANGLQ